jgi:hypothetical protein
VIKLYLDYSGGIKKSQQILRMEEHLYFTVSILLEKKLPDESGQRGP